MSLSARRPTRRACMSSTGKRRTFFSLMIFSAAERSSSEVQTKSCFDITVETLISLIEAPCKKTAMQTSRSVTIPTTCACSFRTGTHPQSFSHMSCAAAARLSDMKQVLTFGVITSLTFMAVILLLASLTSWRGAPARVLMAKPWYRSSGIRSCLCALRNIGVGAAKLLLHLDDTRDAGAGDKSRHLAAIENDKTAAVRFVHLVHRLERGRLRRDFEARPQRKHDVPHLLVRSLLRLAVTNVRQRQHAQYAPIRDHGKPAVAEPQKIMFDGFGNRYLGSQRHRFASHDVAHADMLESLLDNRALVTARCRAA